MIMSSQLFHKSLTITASPLRASFAIDTSVQETHNHYSVHQPAEILSDALLAQFDTLNLRASNVALFFKIPSARRSLIHCDVGLVEGKWKKNIAALNWNLTSSESTMSWYHVDEVEVEPDLNPVDETPEWYYCLNGNHYGYRRNMDIPEENVKCLETAAIYGATLVRTDIPHAIINAGKLGRWALSVRFDPDFATWEEAVAAFSPVLAVA